MHPDHRTLRVDYCGALMVGGTPARGVEANRVLFEQTAAYRDRQSSGMGRAGLGVRGAGPLTIRLILGRVLLLRGDQQVEPGDGRLVRPAWPRRRRGSG